MKTKFIQFLTRYFALILLVFSVLGLIIPINIQDVSYYLLGLLFIIIFSSFFQLDFDWGPLKGNIKTSAIYVLFRYVIFPVVIFYLFRFFDPYLATVFAYLALLPPGVSSPAVSRINNGNIGLALIILLFGNLIILVSIPVFSPIIFEGAQVRPIQLLNTLLFTIALPFFAHLPLRRVPSVKRFMGENLTIIVTTALSTMLLIAISKYRHQLLENLNILPRYVVISILGYLLLYATGWMLLFIRNRNERISSLFTSGMNNIGLGISLAIIFFPEDYILFFIVCEFVWTFSLLPARLFLKIKK